MRGRRHGGVAREGDAAHRPGAQLQQLRRGEAGWLLGRARAAEVLRRGDAVARRRLAQRGGQRTEAGRVVTRVERVGGHPQPAPRDQGKPAMPADFDVVHAHAARDRHAAADGAGARLARHPDRLRRHPRPRPGPHGWGAKGHPEWGAFTLGKTNPNFSTSALSATIAQYYAATGKTPASPIEDLDKASSPGLRTRRRVLGRALRRHHPHVPQQPVPQ